MKILITGSVGNIGRNLINYLNNFPYHIIATGLKPHEQITGKKLKYRQLDILKKTEIEKIFSEEQPDTVVHLAGLTPELCQKDPQLAKLINIQGTRNIGNISAKYHIKKFIFSSTAAVYYQTKKVPVSESFKPKPSSIYGQTKLQAERELAKIAQKRNFSLAIMRIFNVYGPGLNNSLINKLQNSEKKRPVDIIDPKNFIRDYIHVSEVCKVIQLLLKPEWQGIKFFNVASGIPRSTESLIKELRKSGYKVYFRLIPGISTTFSIANINKLNKFLKYQPVKDLII